MTVDSRALACGNARAGDDEHPCDPVGNGDGTATCTVCGWTGGFPAQARELAVKWATGEFSHLNEFMSAETDPANRAQTLVAVAQADAAEVTKWTSLALLEQTA